MIAIWGSRESGKTTFIIALYYEIVKRQQENGTWKMFAADDDDYSSGFIIDGFRNLVENRQFPERTSLNSVRALRFSIERPLDHHYQDNTAPSGVIGRWLGKMSELLQTGMGAHTQQDTLDFLDPSGEYFLNPKLLTTDDGARYRESLVQCDGLICLVDPVRQDGSSHYFPLLYRNFAMLARLMRGEGNPGPLPVPVAICVTKIDQFPYFDDEGASAEAFLRKHMGPVDFSVFTTFCDQVRFFGTTAIGMSNVEKVGDKFVPLSTPNPRNVLEPIEWLMSKGAASS